MSNQSPVYIGVAWPYANGPLHLGHIAGSLLPPDVFRRYQRMAGRDVLMVSGSDCHGTPILLQAERDGKSPQEVVDHFHASHVESLRRLGIHFDLFTRTGTDNHRETVQQIFKDALDEGFIETRTQPAPFDAAAGRFLPDRYVEGTCPHCEFADARGDQCDNCGKTLDPQELKNPRSKLNPDQAIEFRDTEHFFFLLSKLQPALERFVADTAGHWRANTLNFTQNWLREGLQDRAITRDLTWGIPIPMAGYDDKRIYVWFEAVCGYLSAAIEWADRAARDDWAGLPDGAANHSAPRGDADAWRKWWNNPETKSYYFLGKDNIPFHTIIWPAILTATNQARQKRGEAPLVLPFDVPANEFLNLGGEQFSKSRGIGIWVDDILGRFDVDAVRYYLSINMPEQRDADWTWDDFLAKVNDELVGTLGNFVHRVLSFSSKHLEAIPTETDADWDLKIDAAIEACRDEMATHLEAVQLKKAMRRFMEFAAWCNGAMQEAAPWKLMKEDKDHAARVLGSLMRLVKALAVFMAPYLPHAADKAWKMLGQPGTVHDYPWADAGAPLESAPLVQPKALFTKLDAKDIPQAPADEGTDDAAQDASKQQGNPSKDGKSEPAKGDSTTELVAFDDFVKVDIRIATIKSVENHPKADRLYVLKLDVGELGERQVVAGLKGHYEVDQLAGQTVAFVANLAPVKLRGVESQGMILAGDDGETVAVLNPNRALPAGSKVR